MHTNARFNAKPKLPLIFTSLAGEKRICAMILKLRVRRSVRRSVSEYEYDTAASIILWTSVGLKYVLHISEGE